MKLNDIRTFIYNLLAQNFDKEIIFFDNQKAEDLNPTRYHIKLTLEKINKDLLEIGGGSDLISGVCKFIVYTPEGFGLSKCFDLLEKIIETFFNKRTEGFFFGNVEMNNNGLNENFFSFDVSINFEYEAF
jgi:hypothetical protein